ncbi:sugar transferase, partial [Streptococcus pneumoniae]|nr:sugar transferase [Streptococcus pneumoniae]
QVSGRSEIKNFDEVVKLDVVYIDGWTIWKDIEILLKTVKVVLMKDGAK